jgi:patatin-related protein
MIGRATWGGDMSGVGTDAGAPQNLRRRLDDDDLEDVRLAVVMSGGVSLAVWIGGVAREINRLTESAPAEGDRNTYAALLDITGSTARVDVIAGTSAGGLNGAFLALATAYGSSLAPLAGLWADKGAFTRLLRSPMQRNPPSLLRGDEYFLPELVSAIDRIYRNGRGYRTPQASPVDLIITTSLMNGEPRTSTDAFGTRIDEVDHHGLFRFRRGARTAPGAQDPYARPAIVRQLALASRSTASFPFAFEASYVPIGPTHATYERPDMAGVANFSRSGFVLDGGVLVNRPVGLALEAIFEQPADRQVRRALAYIDPNPSGEGPHEHQQPEHAPSVRQVMVDSLLTLPRAQSIAKELAELEQHNRDVRSRREARLQIDSVAGRSDAAREELARSLFATYRQRRIQRALAHVLTVAGRNEIFGRPPEPDTTDEGAVPAWSEAEFAAAFEAAAEQLPFIPPADGLDEALSSEVAWRFGLATVERLAWVTIDVFRRAMWVAPMEDRDLRRQLREQRERLHGWLTPLREYRSQDVRFWVDQLQHLPAPPATSSERNEELAAWLRTVGGQWSVSPRVPDAEALRRELRVALERSAWAFAEILADNRATVVRAARAGRTSTVPGIPAEAEALERLLAVIYPGSSPARDAGRATGAAATMRQLIVLEVLHLLLAPSTDIEQGVELMQISGWTGNSFSGPSSPATKLAGSKLGHFGAFYKQSWRVNDWIWGRLDGATRLCQLVLSPDRLRQLHYPVEEAVDAIRAAALGPPDDPDHAADRTWLAGEFDEPACRRELAYLDDLDLPVPPSLPQSSMMIARRLHLEILRAELPDLIAAVQVDEDAGALRQSNGARLRARYGAVAAQAGASERIPAGALVELFGSCGIGQETVTDDAGSDLFAGTVSQASVVGVSVLDAPTSGLGPARAITRSLRGLVLLLYALVAGSVRGGFGNFAVALTLAVGGALLAVGLLVEDLPDLLANLGTALVLGGVALAALRSRLWQFALFVGLPLIAVIIALWATTAWADIVEHLGNIAVIGGLVGLSLAVGSLKMRERAPWPVDGSGGTLRRVVLPWAAIPVAAVLFSVVARLWPDEPGHLTFQAMLTVERAQSFVSDWSRSEFDAAMLSTVVDFGLLAVYWLPIAALNGYGAQQLARRGRGQRSAVTGARLAILAASLALTAAILDAIENLGILTVLQTARTAEPLGSLAALPAIVPAAVSVAAGFKWLFLVLSVLYGLGAAMVWVPDWRRSRSDTSS